MQGYTTGWLAIIKCKEEPTLWRSESSWQASEISLETAFVIVLIYEFDNIVIALTLPANQRAHKVANLLKLRVG